MESVGDIDELCRDAQLITPLAHAPFQDVGYIQLLPNYFQVHVLALKGKRRGPPDYF